jgi:hypothetical protein
MSKKGGFWGGLGQLGGALWWIGAAFAMVWAFFVVGIPRLCALDATVGKSIRARKAYNDLHSPLATHKKIVVDVTYANTSIDALDQTYNATRGRISKGQWDQFVAKFYELGRSGTVAEDRAQLRSESKYFHLVGNLQSQPEVINKNRFH